MTARRRARDAASWPPGSASRSFPALGLPAFFESFLYLVFHWIALATSWSILSGYAGLLQLRPRRVLRRGDVRDGHPGGEASACRFCGRCPCAGLVAAILATAIGAVVFRVKRLRGELFGLLTLAVTFVLATIVLNTRIDGGPGVYLSAVPMPRLVASPTGTLYLLGLALAVAARW